MRIERWVIAAGACLGADVAAMAPALAEDGASAGKIVRTPAGAGG